MSVLEKKSPRQIDQLYEDYCRDRTKQNWKFWIFGFIMKPLFSSFKETISTETMAEFAQTAKSWVDENMSLVSLRQVVLNALRKISTQTCIMEHPERLQTEALMTIDAPQVVPEQHEAMQTAVTCTSHSVSASQPVFVSQSTMPASCVSTKSTEVLMTPTIVSPSDLVTTIYSALTTSGPVTAHPLSTSGPVTAHPFTTSRPITAHPLTTSGPITAHPLPVIFQTSPVMTSASTGGAVNSVFTSQPSFHIPASQATFQLLNTTDASRHTIQTHMLPNILQAHVNTNAPFTTGKLAAVTPGFVPCIPSATQIHTLPGITSTVSAASHAFTPSSGAVCSSQAPIVVDSESNLVPSLSLSDMQDLDELLAQTGISLGGHFSLLNHSNVNNASLT